MDTVRKINEPSPNLMDMLRSGQIKLIVNTLTRGRERDRDGFRIRRAAVENNIPCLTSLDTLITTATQELETLKTHKKGLMQQLFPSAEAVQA